ncbi:MAG: tripartite tricarboxylate transporter TctB family protein [Spirochaetia bacterium]|nr:tripartite tricarboxylate transporter TctB family protein [Spirochaetia bacterium]
MKGKYKGLAVGIIFLVVSLLYIIGAINIRTFTPFGHTGLNSKSIPQTLGICMAVLSIVKIVKEVKLLSVSTVPDDGKKSVEYVTLFGKKVPKIAYALVLTVGLIALYIIFYRPIGFLLSSILFLVALTLFLCPVEKRTKKLILFVIVFSILFSWLVYFIFTTYFSMVLPKGILF